ncbi:MAG: CDP-alcohol phosphatidyltransferase family protein [Bacteroidia bacterium]|nr:CDP-alcohol phosphatidyltransferase family protein [Bacteroidia bacterium]
MGSTIRSFLPNLFTLGNLALGSWAIVLSYDRDWQGFALTLIAAMGCDWLDGGLARLLKAESSIGKELDALADLVSFGIAPAFALYNYLREPLPYLLYGREVRFWMVVAPFALPLLAAWRLARFNAAPPTNNRFFEGLPTPAHGAFWAGWLLTQPSGLWLHPVSWFGLIILLGAAMVSRWPFLSLKSRENLSALSLLVPLAFLIGGFCFSLDPSIIPPALLCLYGGGSVLVALLSKGKDTQSVSGH